MLLKGRFFSGVCTSHTILFFFHKSTFINKENHCADDYISSLFKNLCKSRVIYRIYKLFPKEAIQNEIMQDLFEKKMKS